MKRRFDRVAPFSILAIMVAASLSAPFAWGDQLPGETTHAMQSYATSIFGHEIAIQRFVDGIEHPDFTATILAYDGCLMARFKYSDSEAESVEILRPDGYFLLRFSNDQWVPARLTRKTRFSLESTPELSAPFALQHAPLFATDAGAHYEFNRTHDGKVDWTSKQDKRRHGSILIGKNGLIEKSVSTLTAIGSVEKTMTYTEDADPNPKLVRIESRGSKGSTEISHLAWQEVQHPDMAPFYLEYYGLSERLLGEPLAATKQPAWTHAVRAIGIIAVLASILFAIARSRRLASSPGDT